MSGTYNPEVTYLKQTLGLGTSLELIIIIPYGPNDGIG